MRGHSGLVVMEVAAAVICRSFVAVLWVWSDGW
jgi:hypothetical protein